MSAKTKIFVFKMKELIYTGIFLALAALLVVLLVTMFRGKSAETGALPDAAVSYTPGVYKSSIALGEHSLEVAVTVDAAHINAVTFTNMNEAVSVMYPLMQTSMNELAAQIVTNQTTDDLTLAEGATYTGTAIVEAVERALEKAKEP